jgi:aminopeptidase-like protein
MLVENAWARQLEDAGVGDSLYALAAEIFPICRSITGNGVRQTLEILGRQIEIDRHEVPTGTDVFDWTIPREWNIRGAWIKNAHGERIVDFDHSNLHVMGYSVPVRRQIALAELKAHIHTLPEQPDLIPYRTSYYSEDWGFCMTHRQFETLREETYEVMIDSSLENGFLTYGEYLHKGETTDEFLLSAHICHPSLANDNCSALAVLAYLARRLSRMKTRYSYRFIFAPGTIGSITWLAHNEDKLHRIKHGMVFSMLGDGGGPTYKRSRRGDATIDRAVAHVLHHSGMAPTVVDFSPYGYDERQYCSPGFDLPVGLLQRSKFGSIPQYHTSADNLEFITPGHLAQSYRLITSALDVIENDAVFVNRFAKCEPQLGKRGLYRAIGGHKDVAASNMAMLWVLNLSDGKHSLLDIAERANLPFTVIRSTAEILCDHEIIASAADVSDPKNRER